MNYSEIYYRVWNLRKRITKINVHALKDLLDEFFLFTFLITLFDCHLSNTDNQTYDGSNQQANDFGLFPTEHQTKLLIVYN